ncbi:MAG: hypothetical protein Q8Q98_14910 [Polaromonas sp.]|nr:hypothetical protein [Polaromonas sp.]
MLAGRLDMAALPPVLLSRPNSLRQLLESEVKLRGYMLKVVADVGSIKTALPWVARGAPFWLQPCFSFDVVK